MTDNKWKQIYSFNDYLLLPVAGILSAVTHDLTLILTTTFSGREYWNLELGLDKPDVD